MSIESAIVTKRTKLINSTHAVFTVG